MNNAKWVMNQKLSDDSDAILSAQGVGFLKRKAINMTTVQVVNTTSVNNGVKTVKSASSASGIPGAQEEIVLDGQPRKSDHSVYGKIISTASLKKPEEVDEAYLTQGYRPDSFDEEGKMIYVYSTSDKDAGNKLTWTGIITSGFQDISVGGKVEKRWCRLNHFKDNKGLEKRIRLVYDFVGTA